MHSYMGACLLVLSADNLCHKCVPRSGSKPFDTDSHSVVNFLKKLILKKVSRRQQKHEKLASMQRVKRKKMTITSLKGYTQPRKLSFKICQNILTLSYPSGYLSSPVISEVVSAGIFKCSSRKASSAVTC